MDPLIILAIFIGFFCTYLVLPYWIKGAKLNGMVGKNMHSLTKESVAEGGGLIVLGGFSISILLYIAMNIFLFESGNNTLISIFALLSTILIASIIGIIDDLLGWKKGLSKRLRLFMILFAAIPLMAINAGTSIISLPFFDTINLGLLYPLLIIPLGIVGATTTFNFIAGYNGLEAGQGMIILIGLSIATYLTGNAWLSVIALSMVASLAGFYIFNTYPAKVFPGDILTYSVGALIAGIAVLGNIERIALLFFLPYIIEVGLKARGKLKKESFAKLNTEGGLEPPYSKIYGIEHIALRILKKIKKDKPVHETDVVLTINFFQAIIVVIVLLVYFVA